MTHHPSLGCDLGSGEGGVVGRSGSWSHTTQGHLATSPSPLRTSSRPSTPTRSRGAVISPSEAGLRVASGVSLLRPCHPSVRPSLPSTSTSGGRRGRRRAQTGNLKLQVAISVSVTAEPGETLAGAGVAGAAVLGPRVSCEGELGGRDAWLRKARVGSSRCGRSRARPWGGPGLVRSWESLRRPGLPRGRGPSCVFVSLCAHSGTLKPGRGAGGVPVSCPRDWTPLSVSVTRGAELFRTRV